MPTKTTKAKPVVLLMPAACPTCNSEKFKKLPACEPIVHEGGGEIAGFQYRKITWTKQKCECGQVFNLRTYDHAG